MESTTLKFKKLTSVAFTPTRATQKSAGYDSSAPYEHTVPKNGRICIVTDLAFQIPDGYYIRVAPRSGLALKRQVDVKAGVVDGDYRGNVGVVLKNDNPNEDFTVERGHRIAQAILTKIDTPELEEVYEFDDTIRGSGGFGSTGQ